MLAIVRRCAARCREYARSKSPAGHDGARGGREQDPLQPLDGSRYTFYRHHYTEDQ